MWEEKQSQSMQPTLKKSRLLPEGDEGDLIRSVVQRENLWKHPE